MKLNLEGENAEENAQNDSAFDMEKLQFLENADITSWLNPDQENSGYLEDRPEEIKI